MHRARCCKSQDDFKGAVRHTTVTAKWNRMLYIELGSFAVLCAGAHTHQMRLTSSRRGWHVWALGFFSLSTGAPGRPRCRRRPARSRQ